MELNALSTLLPVLIALSMASERLVEIIKGFFPALNEEKSEPKEESRRKAYLQILAVVAGLITVLLAKQGDLLSNLPGIFTESLGVITLGLLASGGSGFWNSVLDYVNEVKKIKKMEKIEKKQSL